MAIEIVATKNGPFLVTGDLSQLELRDGDGNLHDIGGKHRVFLCRCGASVTKPFLCRCGASVTKPFCDGHHTKIGFQAAEAAVRERQ